MNSTHIINIWAQQDSELRIQQGRAWATLGTGGEDVTDNYGDHFLSVGDTLVVAKGQNLVLESMGAKEEMLFKLEAIYS